jgi:hypothetical protein
LEKECTAILDFEIYHFHALNLFLRGQDEAQIAKVLRVFPNEARE